MHTSVNFLSQAYFNQILHKSKAENQLEFQQQRVLAQCVHTTLKMLRRETPDFIIAPNLWLLNISDFSPVHDTILTMLQE